MANSKPIVYVDVPIRVRGQMFRNNIVRVEVTPDTCNIFWQHCDPDYFTHEQFRRFIAVRVPAILGERHD